MRPQQSACLTSGNPSAGTRIGAVLRSFTKPIVLFLKRILLLGILASVVVLTSCNKEDEEDRTVTIPNFNFPQTVTFEESLLAYDVYQGTLADLTPADDFHLVELSSVLYTDHAHKQRLVHVPAGQQAAVLDNGSFDYPDGSVLVKTFYYYHDEQTPADGKRVLETRLLIKAAGTWNAATYLWNEAQDDATLTLNGHDMDVSWISDEGLTLSTRYHVPTQNECMTCHQSGDVMSPLGPSVLNLNRTVERDGSTVHQLEHLHALGVVDPVSPSDHPSMVNYHNTAGSLEERGRAYLAMNCAHCHNPHAWDIPAEKGFDFRWTTPLSDSGIPYNADRIVESVESGKMPFIGTTLLDEEGVALIRAYMESL